MKGAAGMEQKQLKQPAAGSRLAASRSPFANYLHNRALSLRGASVRQGRLWRSPVDRAGMIVDQRLLADYRMGAAASSGCGCGWIACYNALALLGRPEPPAKIIRELEPAFALRGRLGTRAAALVPFFLRRGFRVSLRGTARAIDRQASGADANILYYLRAPRGGHLSAHFVAFSGGCGVDEKGETVYRFYNSLSAPVSRRRAAEGENAPCCCAGGDAGDLRSLAALLAPERPLFALALCIRKG